MLSMGKQTGKKLHETRVKVVSFFRITQLGLDESFQNFNFQNFIDDPRN